MKTSVLGISLIKECEKLELKAYRCPAGVLTIGYGHTGKDVFEGMEISEKEAIELLRKDVYHAEKAVVRLYPEATQNQFDALVSFVFNCGVTAFANSTLLKRIRTKSTNESIKAAFLMWIKADGKELKGLKIRREKEYNLFVL